AGRRVVVTHHLPSWHSVSPAYVAAPSNPAFASDLDALVPRADLWIHGHTHSSHDYLLGGCRVVCNPRGYPMRAGGFENPRFDPVRIVTVD
ncbi:MAG: metallophosphoesterase, partial [Burkholderiales bacterium]|nr:metallophosphoesterase [Burkholderiales bacterium]